MSRYINDSSLCRDWTLPARAGTIPSCWDCPTTSEPACSTSTACSPTPPSSTARRGSSTFDAFLTARHGAAAVRRARTTTSYVDGKPRLDGVRDFLAARGIDLPEGDADDPPDAETVRGIGDRKNDDVLRRIKQDGVHGVRGLAALPRGGRDAGLRRAVVSSSANTEQVLEVTGLADCVEDRVDGRDARRDEHLAGKPAPDSFLAGARLARRRRRRRRRSSRTRLAGVEAGRRRRLRLRRRGRPASARRQALREHGADVVVDDLAELLRHEAIADRLPGRAVARARDGPGPRHARPGASRCSRCRTGTSGCAATSTRASRTALPGTYLNAFYETRPLPYAEAGYGYPESGQTVVNVTNGKLIRLLVDDEPFDLRYGEMLRHERVLDLRRGVLDREVEWRSPAGTAGPGAPHAARLARPSARIAAIQLRGGGGRQGRPRSSSSRNWSRTRSCRRSRPTRAWPRPSTQPLERVEPALRADARRCSSTAPRRAGCGWPPAWTTRWRRRTS